MDCMDRVVKKKKKKLQEDCVTLSLRFAIRKGEEEQNLGFNDDEDPRHLREFRYGTWLKSLLIGYAELNEEAIQNILMGSPVLECLKFHQYHGFARINIGSESPTKLSKNRMC